MLLSVLIVSLVAGICYGQDPSRYSDCSTVQTISNECASKHLEYLENNQGLYVRMKLVSEIDNPRHLLENLDDICNKTDHLKGYYMCVFTNLTTCLTHANSSQLVRVPDVDSISSGVADMCNKRAEMNKTCIKDEMEDVTHCLAKDVGDVGMGGPCMAYTKLRTCMEDQMECQGHEVVKSFVVSARPNPCPGNSAPGLLSSAVLLVATLLAHLLHFQ